MNEFLEILKYTLPSLVVFVTAFYLIRTFLDNELKQLKEQQKDDSRKVAIPLKFQAYERIVLFLERIRPDNLVIRVNKPGMNKEMLQTQLLGTVREEYEHNLAQQIYMSEKAWGLVKSAKEEVLSDINTAAGKMSENNTAADYGQQVISLHLGKKNPSHEAAIKFIKEEIKEMF